MALPGALGDDRQVMAAPAHAVQALEVHFAMPTPSTLERFIARVESNAHAEAIAEFYAEHGRMRENQAAPRVGRDHLVAHEQSVLKRAKSVESICVRPVLTNGPVVVIRWIFRFQWLDGSFTQMEEIAYQRWEGERIVEEQFFYDPAQLKPVAAQASHR